MDQTNKFIKSPLTALILSAPLLLASSVVAAQDSGFYIGGSIGEARTHISRSDLTETFEANGRQVSELDRKDERNAGKLLIGYDFNNIFATEFSYFDLGKHEFNSTLVPGQNMRGRANIDGFGLDLVATAPLMGNFSGLARVGVTHTSVTQSFSTFPTSPATGFSGRTPRDIEFKVGFGLEYAFTDALSARAELERYQLPDNQITGNYANMGSVGVVYRFGRTAAPEPVAPTPAPTPAPRPEPTPPPAPEPVNVTLESDVLFGFDDATITAAGRQELDALVRQINDLDYDAAIVVGHTDRIGSREYNLGLSQRRADAVRNYLVQGGVPANTITARGVANDEATIATDECRNLGGGNQATIACLAPDRRVVIEIDGTREP